MEELKSINKSFPSVERLDGWVPRDVDEERKVVLAAKKDGKKIVFQIFKPAGVWKEVYDLMVSRKKIIHEMDKMETRLHGPAIFTSKEFVENGFSE